MLSDSGPQMPWVVGSTTFASETEGLTRVAANEAIHESTPRSSVEGVEIGPDRSRVQLPARHRRRQNRGSLDVPLHVQDAASTSTGSAPDGEVETSPSGA